MGYIVLFNRLAGIPNAALLVPPIVRSVPAVPAVPVCLDLAEITKERRSVRTLLLITHILLLRIKIIFL